MTREQAITEAVRRVMPGWVGIIRRHGWQWFGTAWIWGLVKNNFRADITREFHRLYRSEMG
jgi:hypothetical protein